MKGINNAKYISEFDSVQQADANNHACIFVDDNDGQGTILTVNTSSSKCIVQTELSLAQVDELITALKEVKSKVIK